MMGLTPRWFIDEWLRPAVDERLERLRSAFETPTCIACGGRMAEEGGVAHGCCVDCADDLGLVVEGDE